ncbi:MAG TPA: beta galactosidase jelly roll domain-containing protein [Chryseolinea sp.]
MKKKNVSMVNLVLSVCMLGVISAANAQEDWEKVLNLRGYWKFSIGDNKKWADPKFVDSEWENIDVPSNWEDEGFNGYNGYAWYRKTFDGTALDKNLDFSLFLGYIDDVDEVYLNGHKIGFSGTFPPRYHTAYSAFRNYYLPKEYINFNGKNLLAVRVFDSEISGGIVSGDIGIFINENDQDLTINLRGIWDFAIETKTYKNDDNNAFLGTDKHTPPVDSKWSKIAVPGEWEHQGYNNFDGTGWYRKQFVIPEELEGEDLVLLLGKIDDFDHTYFNGKWIGSTNWHDRSRFYTIPSDLFNGGAVNILLIYVKDGQGRGGIYEGPIGIMKQSDFTRYYRRKNK